MDQEKDVFDDSSAIFFKSGFLGKIKFSSAWHIAFISRYTSTCTEITKIKRENIEDVVTILDVGCGNKTFYQFWSKSFDSLLRPRVDYLGLEYDQEVVDEANVTSGRESVSKYEVVQCDLNTTSFHDIKKHDKYDVILLQEILEHIPKETALKLIKEASELVSDRGFIVISSPNPKKDEGQEFVWPENHIQEFTLDEMHDMITSNGLSVRRVNGWLGKARYFKKHLSSNNTALYNQLKNISQGFAASTIAFLNPRIAECYIFIAEKNKGIL